MTWPLVIFGCFVALFLWKNTRTTARALALVQRMRRDLDDLQLGVSMATVAEGVWEWELGEDTWKLSPGFCRLLGLTKQPADIFELIEEDQRLEIRHHLEKFAAGAATHFEEDVIFRHSNGSRMWMACRAQCLRNADGKALTIQGSVNDISDLRLAREELERSSTRDALTKLPNRRAFAERLENALSRQKRDPSFQFAVLFFDFDRFKLVNDSLGHAIGDSLLVSIASRFRENVRDLDITARFEGDEFVVLLDGIADRNEALEIGDRLLQTFALPHRLQGHQVVSTASIGVVVSEPEYGEADDLLRDAAIAMEAAKTQGKARYCIFDKSMRSEAMARLHLEEELRSASLDDHFRVYYQPIVHIESAQIAGFEALVRWEHPQHGIISPDDFIRIAEETGLIVPLGEWILRRGCAQLRSWTDTFGAERGISVNVNLSRRQLVNPEIVNQVQDAITDFGVNPAMLKLEITESTILDERENLIPVITKLKETGAAIAMDDFGTGHSSLSCLHNFPLDVLKIDQSFVVSLEERRELTAVLHSIVTLARDLDLSVVAEGIESSLQLAQLQAMDCDYAQGYLFAKPLTAEEATKMLQKPELSTH